MPKVAEFHGILAVGRSKTDACNKYRLLAMGKGAAAQLSKEQGISFVTQASHAEQMFNPLTGDMDLETDNQLLDKLDFASNSSADIEANHLVCESGCGAHVIFDSESLVKFCPQCTASLADESVSGEDEDENEEDDSEDLGDGSDDEGEEDFDEGSESGDDCESDDDEGDEEDDEEGDDEDDSSAVVSSSYEEALSAYASHCDLTSLSAGEQVKAHYVVCSSAECGAHIMSAKAVGECPVCLSEVQDPEGDVSGIVDLSKISQSDDLGDGSVPGDDISDDSSEDEGDEGEGEEDDAGSEEDAGEDEGEGEPEGDAESEEEPEAAGEVEDDAEGEASDDVPAVTPEGAPAEGEPAAEAGDDEGEGEGDDSNALSVIDADEEDEGDELNEDTEEIAADSDMDESASADDLDVSYSSVVGGQAAWTAYHKGTPIAMARKSEAGANADLFDSPSFGQAALATAKVAGVKKALAELGFKPIMHKVSVSKEVRRMVDAQVTEQREAIASEIKGYQEKFMAALATSAVGINRGFFAGVSNPLKAALWNAMSSAGVRNPEVVIDNAFKAHSDAYHSVLFAQAKDIVAKPKEVQESLASAVLGTNYQAVSSEQPGDSLENRLAGMGTSVSTEQKPGVTAAAVQADPGIQKIHRAVSSLGRRVR